MASWRILSYNVQSAHPLTPLREDGAIQTVHCCCDSVSCWRILLVVDWTDGGEDEKDLESDRLGNTSFSDTVAPTTKLATRIIPSRFQGRLQTDRALEFVSSSKFPLLLSLKSRDVASGISTESCVFPLRMLMIIVLFL
jgi:hypothetical protein